jgi:hypothetical protein
MKQEKLVYKKKSLTVFQYLERSFAPTDVYFRWNREINYENWYFICISAKNCNVIYILIYIIKTNIISSTTPLLGKLNAQEANGSVFMKIVCYDYDTYL